MGFNVNMLLFTRLSNNSGRFCLVYNAYYKTSLTFIAPIINVIEYVGIFKNIYTNIEGNTLTSSNVILIFPLRK